MAERIAREKFIRISRRANIKTWQRLSRFVSLSLSLSLFVV